MGRHTAKRILAKRIGGARLANPHAKAILDERKRQKAKVRSLESELKAEGQRVRMTYIPYRWALWFNENCKFLPTATLLIFFVIQWYWAVVCFVVAVLLLPISENYLTPALYRRASRVRCKEIEPITKRSDTIPKMLKDIEATFSLQCTQMDGYPPDWAERRRAVLARDNFECIKCCFPRIFPTARRKLHVHHIRPLKRGGTNALSNLVTLCNKCHSITHKTRGP